MKTKKITQEDVDRAWKAWEKVRDEAWKARKARDKALEKAQELERKFREQEDLDG